MRVESMEKPAQSFILDNRRGNLIDVVFFDDIKTETKVQDNEDAVEVYTYKKYKITTIYRENLEEEIQNNLDNWLEDLKTREYDSLASSIRDKRNKLLEESDKHMVLDRIGFEIPEELTTTNLLTAVSSFFTTLGNLKNNDWSKYRQELRDLTKQEGFPYDVKFPTPPEE